MSILFGCSSTKTSSPKKERLKENRSPFLLLLRTHLSVVIMWISFALFEEKIKGSAMVSPLKWQGPSLVGNIITHSLSLHFLHMDSINQIYCVNNWAKTLLSRFSNGPSSKSRRSDRKFKRSLWILLALAVLHTYNICVLLLWYGSRWGWNKEIKKDTVHHTHCSSTFQPSKVFPVSRVRARTKLSLPHSMLCVFVPRKRHWVKNSYPPQNTPGEWLKHVDNRHRLQHPDLQVLKEPRWV